MRINHQQAIILEAIVRKVYSCDRGGMGGYIDADHLSSEPFDAALIARAPLWKNAEHHEIEDFLFKWEVLRSANDEPVDEDAYIEELGTLINDLMAR